MLRSSQLTLGRFIASLSRVVLGQKRARPAERKDFETAKSGGYPFYAQLDVRTMTLWLLPYWCIMYGAQLAMITTHRTGFTSNALAIKWPIIPFRTVIGKFTFIANLTVRICDIHPLDTAYRLAIRRIIPLSSDIVKACENRDLATVQGLLECRKYGPNDMTEDYRPLLWVRLSRNQVQNSIVIGCSMQSVEDHWRSLVAYCHPEPMQLFYQVVQIRKISTFISGNCCAHLSIQQFTPNRFLLQATRDRTPPYDPWSRPREH